MGIKAAGPGRHFWRGWPNAPATCLMGAPHLFDPPDGADAVFVVLDAEPPESERARALRAAAMCLAQSITVS